MKYVAFLRGINVGGHRPIKMAELAEAFGRMGFSEVKTVQASGNVLFEAVGAASQGPRLLIARIETGLREDFGYPIGVIVRRLADLDALAASEPFAGVAVTPATRLYVTFLSTQAENGAGGRPEDGPVDLPVDRPKEVRMLTVTPGEVLTAIDLAPRWGTTELMAWLEREFGPGLTTRNWNTIAKIVSP
jgi:uncharacterized protein (DUF1697 family)